MKYMVPLWGAVLLVLYGFLATAALFVGGYATVQAKVETMRAHAVVFRADSIHKDWVARGCAPRTSPLP